MKPIKKRLVPLVLCLPIAAALLSSPPANAAQGAIVRVTLTSVWATPSPDPMGITYDARTKRLLISDSEVDEMPGLRKGRNLFVVKRREISSRPGRSRSSPWNLRTSRWTAAIGRCTSPTTISIGVQGQGRQGRRLRHPRRCRRYGPSHSPVRLPRSGGSRLARRSQAHADPDRLR